MPLKTPNSPSSLVATGLQVNNVNHLKKSPGVTFPRIIFVLPTCKPTKCP